MCTYIIMKRYLHLYLRLCLYLYSVLVVQLLHVSICSYLVHACLDLYVCVDPYVGLYLHVYPYLYLNLYLHLHTYMLKLCIHVCIYVHIHVDM